MAVQTYIIYLQETYTHTQFGAINNRNHLVQFQSDRKKAFSLSIWLWVRCSPDAEEHLYYPFQTKDFCRQHAYIFNMFSVYENEELCLIVETCAAAVCSCTRVRGKPPAPSPQQQQQQQQQQ
mmetsp:Transcript_11115/g.18588  ORF Transcript_11115/g.18588 Transcript_11115/m.18588 type:complete len:122 (-) Transcript_11115:12-377(-)